MVNEKKKKKQGPIRTGAVVPFLLIMTGIVVFNLFFLDLTIKKSLELLGGKLNGAEVNVNDVTSSFKDLKITLSKIQITDKENPELNKLEIGSMDFQLMWDALLRGKIAITMANVNNILLGAKRSLPGEVFPVELDEGTGNSKATQEILNKTKKEFEGNVFGDIAGILSGESAKETGKEIQGTLKSKKKFDQIKIQIKNKEKSISADMKKLPSGSDLKKLQARLNSIRWKDLGNILKAPKVLKKADTLHKDINKSLKSYNAVSKNFSQSFKEIEKSYKEAEALIADDIKSVGSRMNLPSLDQKSIVRILFGNEILDKVGQAKKYQAMAEKYMPPKKEKVEIKKVARKKGVNYKFGKPNSYPLFWLKLAKINSKNEQGTIDGKIENITNDQIATGKLTTAQLTANFPLKKMKDIVAKITIDHRADPVVSIDGGIGSFLVQDKALSNSEEATFILKKSDAFMSVKGLLKPESASIIIKNKFRNIQYETGAKSAAVAQVLKDVSKKNKTLTLDAKVTGKWESLKFEMKSNLASAIQSSVRSLIQEKINKIRRKIKADIEKQIAASRGEVDSQVKSIKAKYNKQLASTKAQINKFKAKFKTEKSKAQKSAKKALKNIKNPFKGIKF